jgi:hypothetical protein
MTRSRLVTRRLPSFVTGTEGMDELSRARPLTQGTRLTWCTSFLLSGVHHG